MLNVNSSGGLLVRVAVRTRFGFYNWRERLYRDRVNPLECYSDLELKCSIRFDRRGLQL